jgi:Flp pilus assembly pilin Flp
MYIFGVRHPILLLPGSTCPFVTIADFHEAAPDVLIFHQPYFKNERKSPMSSLLPQLWHDEQGQDIAEYAVMLAVILVVVVGTIRLVGSNANNVFSSVASSVQ